MDIGTRNKIRLEVVVPCYSAIFICTSRESYDVISIISMQSMVSANYPVIYSRSYIFLHTDHNQKYESLAIA